MAKSEARRQKQLAKKKAKRTEKRSELARLTSDDPMVRLANAESWLIVESLVPVNLWDEGIGNIILTRRAPGGQFACAVFLVDVWCLGVKNAFWKVLNGSDYNKLLKQTAQHGELREVAPEYLAKLVLSSVDYAQALGCPPHPDYRAAKMLLAGIDPSLCPDTFEFGKDGKPYYYRGPHESLTKAKAIAERINAAGGEVVILMKSPREELAMKGTVVDDYD